jgi:hypothetical protein
LDNGTTGHPHNHPYTIQQFGVLDNRKSLTEEESTEYITTGRSAALEVTAHVTKQAAVPLFNAGLMAAYGADAVVDTGASGSGASVKCRMAVTVLEESGCNKAVVSFRGNIIHVEWVGDTPKGAMDGVVLLSAEETEGGSVKIEGEEDGELKPFEFKNVPSTTWTLFDVDSNGTNAESFSQIEEILC